MESLPGCLFLILIKWFRICSACVASFSYSFEFKFCAYMLLADFLSQFNHLEVQIVITNSKTSQSTPNFNSLLKAILIYILRAMNLIIVSSLLCESVCFFSQCVVFFCRRVEFHSTTNVVLDRLFIQKQNMHTNSKSIREQSEWEEKKKAIFTRRRSLPRNWSPLSEMDMATGINEGKRQRTHTKLLLYAFIKCVCINCGKLWCWVSVVEIKSSAHYQHAFSREAREEQGG